jgi:Flp pilus assembly protein CpaB
VLGVSAARPHAMPTRAVWVAARDLGGGSPLHPGDVRIARFPIGLTPVGALPASRPVVGRMLAAPVRRGEPLTDLRLLSPSLLDALGAGPDVAVPVRVTDGSATLALVQAGDRVDVIAIADPSAGQSPTAAGVVQDVRVLAVADQTSEDGAGVVIVAATPAQAATLAGIPAGSVVSVALRSAR